MVVVGLLLLMISVQMIGTSFGIRTELKVVLGRERAKRIRQVTLKVKRMKIKCPTSSYGFSFILIILNSTIKFSCCMPLKSILIHPLQNTERNPAV